MKLVWLTDLHLNFITKPERLNFYQTLVDTTADSVLISGDSAEAPSIREILMEMVQIVDKPICFVLGNHDFYRGSVECTRNDMKYLTQTSPYLHWLPTSGVYMLTDEVLLVGTDGFADGRYGDYEKSSVVLNDSYLIAELFKERLFSKEQLLFKMRRFADEDAAQLCRDIETGIMKCRPKKVIVLTHVPPFPEVCLYQGQQTDDNYLPYFASKATGDVLLSVAANNPLVEFIALCGHTHHYAKKQVLANLTVTVGAAEYHQPVIQEIIFV